MTVLNPTRGVYSVLGCICNNVELLRTPTVILKERDFYKNLDKILFSAIYNIAFSDYEIKKITAVDIDNYLAQYKKLYKIYEQYNGYKYISSAIEQSNIETFGMSYHRVKVFSLLRHYQENGFDIKDLFNPDEDDFQKIDDVIKKLDVMSEDDIIEYFTLKAISVRDSWDKKTITQSFQIGDGLEELICRLGESPVYGSPYYWNKYLNTILRGKLKKRFNLVSGGTGAGKSRSMIADAVEGSCDKYYSYERRRYIDIGNKEPTLFISTELDIDELQTIAIAHISGVGQGIIEKGNQYWSDDTRARIIEACNILKDAPLYFEVIKDFNINDIDLLIERYIVEHGVANVYFDYIQITPKLSRSMNELFGNKIRNDEILVYFSSQLKDLTEKHDIYLCSGTQVSREPYLDARKLAGGMHTADKIDQGRIIMKMDNEMMKNIEKQLKANPSFMKPNYYTAIYKNRKGRDGLILFSKMDLGTYREEFCFITDMNYNILTDIQPTDIVVQQDDEEINF